MIEATMGEASTASLSGTAPDNAPSANLLLGLGLLHGLLANLLLHEGLLTGPGFIVWIAVLAASAVILQHFWQPDRQVPVAAYALLSVAATFMLIWRDTPLLILAMWLVLLSAAAMVFTVTRNISAVRATIPQLLGSCGRVPRQAVIGSFPLLGRLQWKSHSANPRVRGILRGVFLAAPLLFLFAALFTSADAAFARLSHTLFASISDNLLRDLVFTAVFAWLSAGLLAGLHVTDNSSNLGNSKFLQLGEEEMAVIMGLLALLFISFVILQLGYLFGGRDAIEATTGLTLAAYARRGFFELMLTAGFTLVLLLALNTVSPASRVFRPLALLLVGCVLIMLVSAAQRLALYTDEFGLTVDRLSASAVMVWLAFSLILFAGLIMRGSMQYLACGIVHGGILVAMCLALANPAAIVTRINFDRADAGYTSIDVVYLLSLGADAVPELLQHADNLQQDNRCYMANGLLAQWSANDTMRAHNYLDDWRTWNFSRARATRLVEDNRSSLEQFSMYCRT